jgi:hypothetical protein
MLNHVERWSTGHQEVNLYPQSPVNIDQVVTMRSARQDYLKFSNITEQRTLLIRLDP